MNIESNNGTQQQHQCPYCPKTFKMLKSHIRHLKLHETSPPHMCEICSKKFHEKSALNRHISVTHFGMKQYECTICRGKYASKANLDKHIRTLHPTAPEIQMISIKCMDCESYFQSKIHHSIHLRTCHRSKAVQESIDIEPENKTRNTDESHNTYEPNSDTDDLLAKALEKSEVELIPEPDIRTAEMVTINHRPHFKCDICGQLRNKMSSLKRHMNLHYTTKPFPCSSCDSRFKNLTELRNHIKIIHNLKCKSNNNGVLWKSLHDLNNHIWTETIKNKNKEKHFVKKRRQKIEKVVDNDNLKNHVEENLDENENAHKLSMPILDEESITSLPQAEQSNKTKNFNPTTIVMIPVSEIYEIEKTANHLEEINSVVCSNQNNVIFTEPITSTGFLKDALLGQANFPLIKEIDVNSRNIAEKYPHTLTNGAFNDQLCIDDVNTGFTYPLSDTDFCAESGLLDKNLLQIIGLNDIMVNTESNELLQPNREVQSEAFTPPNKLQEYISNIPLKSIIKLKNDEGNERAVIISEQINDASNKTLCNKDSIIITPQTSYENNELIGENRISEISNNIKISDFHQFNETQSDSRLLGMCGNNTDISLNECNIDVSFDLNELSSEFDHASISLTDIVEGMCSQNYVQRNPSIDGENCIINNESNDEFTVKGKEITSVTTTTVTNRTETEIVNVESFLLGTTNQKESFKTYIDNINYGSDVSTKTITGAHTNMNTCTVPIHIQEPNRVQATNPMEIKKYVYQNISESPQIMNKSGLLTTSPNSIVNTVKKPETPNDFKMCTAQIHMQETDQVQATNPMEIEKYVHQNMNESSQIKSKLVLPTSIINAVEESEPSTNHNTVEEQIEFRNAYLTNFNLEDPVSIYPTNDIIQNDDNAMLPYHEETNINNTDICTGVKGILISQLSGNNAQINSKNVLQNNLVPNENEAFFTMEQYESQTTCNLVDNANDHHQNKPSNNFTPNLLELPSDAGRIENVINNLATKVNLFEKDSPMQYDLSQTFVMHEHDSHFTIDPQLLQSNVPNEDTRTHAVTDYTQLEKDIDTTSDPFIESLIMTIVKKTNTKEGPLSTCERDPSRLEKVLEKMKINSFKNKCKECPASFQRVCDLRRHEDTHKPRPKYLCDLCGKIVASKFAMTTHIKYHNSKKTLCWVCGRMICEINFGRHKCFSNYVYKCPLCDERFLSGHLKRRHILQKHIYKSNGQRKINSLEGAEDNLVGLIEQLNEDSCEILNPIKKKVASVTTKPKTYKCELCQKEYKRNDTLRKHIEKHDENIQQEFRCECGAMFIKKLHLLQHQKKNGNKPHKNPFICKFCSKAFSKRSLLKIHLEKYECLGKVELSQ